MHVRLSLISDILSQLTYVHPLLATVSEFITVALIMESPKILMKVLMELKMNIPMSINFFYNLASSIPVAT